MIKSAILAAVMLMLTACSPDNEAWYRTHPKALKAALMRCPASPGNVSCERLREIALEVNQLIQEMQVSPQAFGQGITTLQNRIAALSLKKGASAAEVKELEDELAMRLAMVKWLQSPES